MTLNPFPGPQPYRAADRNRFYGRDVLIKKLANQILARQATTVFGPSGAGKSSLLQAGVIPRLEDSDDIRLVRVDAWPTDEIPLQWLVKTLESDLDLGLGNEATNPMDALQRALDLAKRQSERALLIYLDQFEQIFIANHDESTMKSLLAGLTWLIQKNHGRALHLVISLREDYLGRLRDFTRNKPELTAHGFRVGPLTVKEMIQAMCRTASNGEPAQTWTPEAIEPLMLDVRVPGQRATEDAEIQAAFAQIICRAIWEERAAGKTVDLKHASAEAILQVYLATTLAGLGNLQDAALGLLEQHLIDDQGQRTLLTEKEARSILPTTDATTILAQLEKAAILHAEEHQGSRYFELGHDWLAKKVFERRIERKQHAEEAAKAAQYQAERKRFRRNFAYATVALVVFVGIALIALQQKSVAEKAKDEAEWSQALAQVQRNDAIRSQQDAVRASRMSTTRELMLRGQTDLAALVLREIDEPQSATGWVQSAIDALSIRLPKKTFRYQDQETALAWNHRGDAVLVRGTKQELRIDFVDTTKKSLPLNVATSPTGRAQFSPDDRFVAVEGIEGAMRVVQSDGSGKFVVLLEPGNQGAVMSIAWSPDGKRVASSSLDKTVRIWNADGSGTPIVHTFDNHPLSIAWSPNGEQIASVVSNRGIIVRNANASGEVTGGLDDTSATFVEWSPDGNSLATRLSDRFRPLSERTSQVAVFSPQSQSARITTDVGKGVIRALRWSPDGQRIAVTIGNIARIIRVNGPDEPQELRDHTADTMAIAWSPDNQRIATSSADKTIRIWNVDARHPGLVLRGHTDPSIGLLSWSADGKHLLSIASDRTARMWAMEGGNSPIVLEHQGKPLTGTWSRDGTSVLITDTDGQARIWKADGSGLSTDLRRGKEAITGAAWSPDGKTIATAASRLESTGTLEPNQLRPQGPLRIRRITAEAIETGAAWSKSSKLEIRKVDALDKPHSLGTIETGLFYPSFSADGSRIAGIGEDNSIHIFDPQKTSDPITIHVPTLDRTFYAWRPDGRQIATFSFDDKVRLWNSDGTGQAILLEGASSRLMCGAYSPDGKRFAAGTSNHGTRIWDVSAPGKPLEFVGHRGSVLHLAWSPDGKYIATVSNDATVRIWNSAGDAQPLILTGHEIGRIVMVQWSSDGQFVLTASDDKTARIWNANGKGTPVVLAGHDGFVSHASWSPDGTYILTLSEDRTARIWPIAIGALQSALHKATGDCLTAIQRRELLLENGLVAKQNYEACIKAQPAQ